MDFALDNKPRLLGLVDNDVLLLHIERVLVFPCFTVFKHKLFNKCRCIFVRCMPKFGLVFEPVEYHFAIGDSFIRVILNVDYLQWISSGDNRVKFGRLDQMDEQRPPTLKPIMAILEKPVLVLNVINRKIQA